MGNEPLSPDEALDMIVSLLEEAEQERDSADAYRILAFGSVSIHDDECGLYDIIQRTGRSFG